MPVRFKFQRPTFVQVDVLRTAIAWEKLSKARPLLAVPNRQAAGEYHQHEMEPA